jgi:thiamine pyrophosphokinase
VANLLLLADPWLTGVDARLVAGPDTVRLLVGPGMARLEGRPGDLVSLLPLGEAAIGVSTAGLRWPLDEAELRAGGTRGLSNEVVEPAASVSLRSGQLLVVEHRTT